MLKLSLIIPVYNEERHIRKCLDSIANQTVMPDEVIVVDNNSSDRSIDIANHYDFVTVVNESKQGRGHARNKGFNAATGDILARIDSDTELKPNWVETVKMHFETDSKLAGLTGIAYTPTVPIISRPMTTLISRTYYWFVHAIFGTVTTWGATMAVSRQAWEKVKDKVCVDDSVVHEDQDIALWMAGQELKIIQANDVKITSSNQSFRYLLKLRHYERLRISTKRFHKKAGNLPAPKSVRISWLLRVTALLLAFIPTVYGVFCSVLFFPVDFVAVKLLRIENWFD